MHAQNPTITHPPTHGYTASYPFLASDRESAHTRARTASYRHVSPTGTVAYGKQRFSPTHDSGSLAIVRHRRRRRRDGRVSGDQVLF